MALKFSDLLGDSYDQGRIPVHVIAFRAPPGKKSYDVIVTDYSRHDSSPFPIEDNRVALASDEKAQIKMSAQAFLALAEAYKELTHQDLFHAEDVDIDSSAWIDIWPSFCFAELRIQLQVGQQPWVRWATIVTSRVHQFAQFWHRFSGAVLGRISVDRHLLFQVVEECLIPEEKALLDAFRGDSTSYSTDESGNKSDSLVKNEHGIKSETDRQVYLEESLKLQEQFSSALENDPNELATGSHHRGNLPNSTDFPSGVTNPPETQELLTQVSQFFSPSQSQTGSHVQTDNQTIGHTQRLLLSDTFRQPPTFAGEHSQSMDSANSQAEFSLTDIYAAQEAGSTISLEALKTVPMTVDYRIYKVRSKIVCTFPEDLTLVCTKSYNSHNGGIVMGDPYVRSFEITLSDTDEKTISPLNSVTVHVPHNGVLPFFDCKYVEQLYTQMEAKKAEFAKLYSSAITLEVSVRYVDRVAMWVLKDLSRMSVLIKELV